MRVINKETGKKANVKTFSTSYYDKKSQAMTKIEFEKMLAKLDIDPDDDWQVADSKGKMLGFRSDFYSDNVVIY